MAPRFSTARPGFPRDIFSVGVMLYRWQRALPFSGRRTKCSSALRGPFRRPRTVSRGYRPSGKVIARSLGEIPRRLSAIEPHAGRLRVLCATQVLENVREELGATSQARKPREGIGLSSCDSPVARASVNTRLAYRPLVGTWNAPWLGTREPYGAGRAATAGTRRRLRRWVTVGTCGGSVGIGLARLQSAPAVRPIRSKWRAAAAACKYESDRTATAAGPRRGAPVKVEPLAEHPVSSTHVPREQEESWGRRAGRPTRGDCTRSPGRCRAQTSKSS